ncbi:MAG: hypothetical protein ACI30I_07925 [Parabacteroides sp.]
MKRLFLLWATWWLSTAAFPADRLSYPDMRMLSVGDCAAISAFQNPAMLALSVDKVVHIGCFNRYLLKELSTLGASFLYPDKRLSTGVDIVSFGYDAYRESALRGSLSKQLGKRWALGVAFRYAFVQSELYERTLSALSTDVGISFQLVDNLFIGMLIQNLPSISLAKSITYNQSFDEYLIQVGFHYQLINGLWMVGYAGTTDQTRLSAGWGMEYRAYEQFFFRIGMQTHPFQPTGGIGWRLSRQIGVDLALLYHTTLGVTGGIGLSYYF